MPVPSDYAVLKAAKQFYGIDVRPDQTEQIERLRHLLYDSKNPKRESKSHMENKSAQSTDESSFTKMSSIGRPKLSKK